LGNVEHLEGLTSDFWSGTVAADDSNVIAFHRAGSIPAERRFFN
jgi:hypothetical protein